MNEPSPPFPDLAEPGCRLYDLVVGESQRGLFEPMRRNSSQATPSLARRWISRIARPFAP